MYERQFGLRENPFSAGHQSKYVYPSREHQEALAHLRFGIENREAFVLITGEVGTGKTTALYDALSEWKSRAVVALITNTALTRSELYEEICMRFGVPLSGTSTKPQLIQQLERHLLVVRARGDYAILLIDEAQNLDSGLLEETRLLSNLEAQGEKLLQIFLVGQPELETMLERPELRQLRQRIAVHYRLRPLSPEETEHYIHHRISVAGGNALTVFPADACLEVHAATHGIPREINTVAAQALLNAFVEDAASVRPEHVRAIVSDTGFRSVLDRPSVPAATHPATGSAATPSTPSPPAAVSPVPVSPPHDVPAPTREVRQVPAAAPRAVPQAGPAPPDSTEPEGHTMAGVRPAGSTESWKSWMDSLAKVPEESTEEGADPAGPPDAATADAIQAAAEIPTQASAEMSPEEFYAVEEAALRSPIGDDEAEDEYGEQVDEDETEGDEADTDYVEPHEVVNASAESAGPPAEAVEGEDPAWLEELARGSGRSAPVEAALGADFEPAPGIQWGDAASRSAEFDQARLAEAMGQIPANPAAPKPAPANPAETEPAYMAEARNFAPVVPAAEKPAEPKSAAPPAPPAPAARPEPATARVSAAPQRPLATAQAMPMRLRERLEAAERAEQADGGRMTGWLIGIAAIAVVAIGVLFALRLRTQARLEAAGTPGTTNTATAPQTPGGSVEPPKTSAAPSAETTAGSPKVEAPKAAPPVTSAPKNTTAAAVTPPPAVKPATTANRNVTSTSTSPGTQTPTTPSSAVVAPVVPKAAPKPVVAPKPAAPKALYGVSVASFLAESRAQSELARLSAGTGVSGRVVATADGDFKVVLGSYPDRRAAEDAAGRMIESGKVDEARVVPLGTKR